MTRNPNKRAQLSPNWNLEKVLKSQIFTLEDGNFRVIFHAWIPYPFIFKQLCKFSGCKKYCAFVTYDLLFPLSPQSFFPRTSLVTIVNFTQFFQGQEMTSKMNNGGFIMWETIGRAKLERHFQYNVTDLKFQASTNSCHYCRIQKTLSVILWSQNDIGLLKRLAWENWNHFVDFQKFDKVKWSSHQLFEIKSKSPIQIVTRCSSMEISRRFLLCFFILLHPLLCVFSKFVWGHLFVKHS